MEKMQTVSAFSHDEDVSVWVARVYKQRHFLLEEMAPNVLLHNAALFMQDIKSREKGRF